MNDRIWISPPHLCGKELEYIQDAFNKNWITTIGDNISGFESDICTFLGENENAVALNSATAALHLSLIILGVTRDDFVICQDLTFAATINPVIYLGAKPVLVDSEEDTWNISPVFLEEAILDCIQKGKKPKAIIWVNLYGMPAKIQEITNIAKKYDIALIEDAAESLGATYYGRKCGTFGDISAISFNGNKIITTSGGGMLLSKNTDYITKARFLATQARDDVSWYQHSQIGYNYGMSNIVAGLGRGQMHILEQRIEQRRKNNQYYKKHLLNLNGISFQTEPSADFYSNFWLTAILVDPEKTKGVACEDLRIALEKNNIESRSVWNPMHLQPVFKKYSFYGEGISAKLFQKGLCLPSGSNLSEKELTQIVGIIKAELKY